MSCDEYKITLVGLLRERERRKKKKKKSKRTGLKHCIYFCSNSFQRKKSILKDMIHVDLSIVVHDANEKNDRADRFSF